MVEAQYARSTGGVQMGKKVTGERAASGPSIEDGNDDGDVPGDENVDETMPSV